MHGVSTDVRDPDGLTVVMSEAVPGPADPHSCCVFRTRCAHAIPACADAVPPLRDTGGGQRVACIRADDIG